MSAATASRPRELCATRFKIVLGITVRQFSEVCGSVGLVDKFPALQIDFVPTGQAGSPLEQFGLVVIAGPTMFLEVKGPVRFDAPILLRVELEERSPSKRQLSDSQQNMLPCVVAVVANQLLQTPPSICLTKSPLASQEILQHFNFSNWNLQGIERLARNRFEASPFPLSASDRFLVAEIKKLIVGSDTSCAANHPIANVPVPKVRAKEENTQMSDQPSNAASQERGLFDVAPPVSSHDLRELRKHVINLSLGKLSQDGIFISSRESVDAIFNLHLKNWIADQSENGPVRLLLYAHGGLTAEGWGLYTAAFQMRWWKEQGIYPIFFVWETGLLETLSQIFSVSQRRMPMEIARGPITEWVKELNDGVIEAAVRRLGGPRIWAGMQTSARLSFEESGDGREVLRRIKDLGATSNRLEIHAVGHSAGSIFLTYALQAAAEMQLPPCETLHFLAPAVTCRLFKERLRSLIGPEGTQSVRSFSMFTMNDEYERTDTVGPYNKSLLYLIYRILEPNLNEPILGLEKSLLEDDDLASFFGLSSDTPDSQATVVFSKTGNDAPNNSRSLSVAHGDFDNDAATMESVLRRIKRTRNNTTVLPFPVDRKLQPAARMMQFVPGEPMRAFPASPTRPSGLSVRPVNGGGGRRLALCIGIDQYPGSNRLFGCVSDCRRWEGWLTSQGFSVTSLTDTAATHSAILGSIRQLFENSNAGDVIAIQYAGHGTAVEDVNGDEISGDTPGKDESLVPIDFEEGNLVLDDDLGELCRSIKQGVNVTFFMDCCHSGTNTRMFMSKTQQTGANQRARFMVLPQSAVEAHARNRQTAPAGTRAFGSPYKGAGEILFAACRSNEVALETNGQGDFTRHAMAVLSENANLSAEQFWASVLRQFGASARQTPGLWCDDGLRQTPLLGQIRAS